MSWIEVITKETNEIFTTKWDERNGNVIPESDNVALSDGAVKIDATFLYADLAGSSRLARLCPWETTAKIIRAYLACCTRSIRVYDGEIRSFDGDRVMGVFKSDNQNDQATKCAREIDWFVEKLINPLANEYFKSIKENAIRIDHCIGIDTGMAVAVRAGIRNNNDLIWIGRAPSFAAKLSDTREYPYAVYITNACYGKLTESNKIVDGNNIWESRSIQFAGETQSIYRTKFMKTP